MYKKKIISIAFFVLFLMSSYFCFATENEYVTEWMPSRQFQSTFDRMADNRFYTHFVEGRTMNGAIQYRAEFRPLFKEMKRWYSFHGMSDEWYARRKAAFEKGGFKELYHNFFLDFSGQHVHQACWVELFESAETPPLEKKGVKPLISF
ncbi:hypothetical protein [Geotalea uraniireducens]|uniref:Uncharacterized protein n=1 Tax=Geotalea uraniireducens (strain Rf4) TaxID=351605 RepID=A5G4K8_GEOUR|nr:hypothetical protein [Geotalea uraniireducens]ABQ26726.1 hypothetical protein Gura_2548 [Geotalea uraniireducens Rf4]